MLVLLLACAPPPADPDALLRAHQLDAWAAAVEARDGARPDVSLQAAEVVARRAATDPGWDSARALGALHAVTLLNQAPMVGKRSLDLSFELAPLFAAAEVLAGGAVFAAVGRSETALDRDVYQGGALAWRDGRVVAWGSPPLAPVAAAVAAEPIPRLLTIAFEDDSGRLVVTAARQATGWWTTAANDAERGAELVLAAALHAEQGAAAVATKYGTDGLMR